MKYSNQNTLINLYDDDMDLPFKSQLEIFDGHQSYINTSEPENYTKSKGLEIKKSEENKICKRSKLLQKKRQNKSNRECAKRRRDKLAAKDLALKKEIDILKIQLEFEEMENKFLKKKIEELSNDHLYINYRI